MRKLYQHQEDIIKENKNYCGLFLGTGSAKTATALHLAEGKILCITPKIQREEMNFKKEAEKWGMKLNITQLSKEDFKKQCNSLPAFDTVIIDEAHTVAGVTPFTKKVQGITVPKASQIYDKLLYYIKKHPPKRLYLLTATPTRNPMVVFGFGKLLGKIWNFYEYRDVFYTKIKKGYHEIWIPKKDNQTKERLGKAVRSLGYTGKLEDYFDVPPQIEKVEYVSLSTKQARRIQKIKLDYPDPLVQVGKKHQVENGVLTDDNAFFDNEKIEKIKDYAIEFPRMVIIAKYTSQIEHIRRELAGYNVIVIDGKTKNRGDLIAQANTMDECIVIAQASVSVGWELPDFPVMIFASMSYSVVDFVQAQGRILRANHLKKNLYIYLVTKGGVDEAVYKAILNKQDFIEKIYVEKSTCNK